MRSSSDRRGGSSLRSLLLGLGLHLGLAATARASMPVPPLEVRLEIQGSDLVCSLEAHRRVSLLQARWRSVPAGALPRGPFASLDLEAGQRLERRVRLSHTDAWIEMRARLRSDLGESDIGASTRRAPARAAAREERLEIEPRAPGKHPGRSSGDLVARFVYEDRLLDAGGYSGGVQLLPLRHVDAELVSAADSTVLWRGRLDAEGGLRIGPLPAPSGEVALRLLASTRQHPDFDLAVQDLVNAGDSRPPVPRTHVLRTGSFTIPAGGLDLGSIVLRDPDGFGRVQAFHVLDVLLDAWQALASPDMLGRYPARQESLRVFWGPTLRLRGALYGGGAIELASPGGGDTDGWSDAVILHEVGHFIVERFLRDNSPGSLHLLGDVDQDPRLAWGEGLASVLACWLRAWRAGARRNLAGEPLDRDVALFVNAGLPPPGTLPGGVQFAWDVEAHTLGGAPLQRRGIGSETNVAGTLWDLLDSGVTPDGTSGDDEDAHAPGAQVWGALQALRSAATPAGVTFEDFGQTWKEGGTGTDLDALLKRAHIEFEADAAEPDAPPHAAPFLEAWSGREPAGGVLVSEIALGARIALEIVNRAAAPRDLAGWQLVARGNGSSGAPSLTYTFPELVLGPGGRIVVHRGGRPRDSTTRDLFADNWTTPWFPAAQGAVALLDAAGYGIDFVRWNGRDGTACTVAPPPGTSWSGGLVAADFGRALARIDSLPDRDQAADFVSAPLTLGAANGTPALHRTFFPQDDLDVLRGRAGCDGTYSLQVLQVHDGATPHAELWTPGALLPMASVESDQPGQARLTVWLRAGQDWEARLQHVGRLTRWGSYDVSWYAEPDARQALPPSGLQVDVLPGLATRPVRLRWWNAGLYDSLQLRIDSGPRWRLDGGSQAWRSELPAGRHRVELQACVRGQAVASPVLLVAAEDWPPRLEDDMDVRRDDLWEFSGTWDLGQAPGRGGGGLTDSPTGNYRDDDESSLRLRAAVLASATTVLGFDHICSVRREDAARLEASDDWGARWQVLARWNWDAHRGVNEPADWRDGHADAQDWVHESLALGQYAGKPLQIRFVLSSDVHGNADGWWLDRLVIESEQPAARAPLVVRLEQNVPNPCNPVTRIRFEVSRGAPVHLRVFDVRGRLVRVLLAAPVEPGLHDVHWDGRDDRGRAAPAGLYLYELRAGSQHESRKLVVVH